MPLSDYPGWSAQTRTAKSPSHAGACYACEQPGQTGPPGKTIYAGTSLSAWLTFCMTCFSFEMHKLQQRHPHVGRECCAASCKTLHSTVVLQMQGSIRFSGCKIVWHGVPLRYHLLSGYHPWLPADATQSRSLGAGLNPRLERNSAGDITNTTHVPADAPRPPAKDDAFMRKAAQQGDGSCKAGLPRQHANHAYK